MYNIKALDTTYEYLNNVSFVWKVFFPSFQESLNVILSSAG